MSRRGLAEVSGWMSDVQRAGPGVDHSVTPLSSSNGCFGRSSAVSQVVRLLPERWLLSNTWSDTRDPANRRWRPDLNPGLSAPEYVTCRSTGTPLYVGSVRTISPVICLLNRPSLPGTVSHEPASLRTRTECTVRAQPRIHSFIHSFTLSQSHHTPPGCLAES